MARKRSGRRQGHCRTSWSNRPGARCPGSCRRIARASLSSLRMARSRTAWPMPPTMRAPHDPATCPTSVRPPSGKILATARQGQGQGRKRRPSPPHHAQALSQARENHGADHLRNSISCAEAYKPDMRPPPGRTGSAPRCHKGTSFTDFMPPSHWPARAPCPIRTDDLPLTRRLLWPD